MKGQDLRRERRGREMQRKNNGLLRRVLIVLVQLQTKEPN